MLGGVADRLDLGFEDLDDLQLAVERLLAEAASQDTVQMRIDVVEHGVRVRRRAAGRARRSPTRSRAPTRSPGELTLRRILQTVVDSFGVEEHAERRDRRAAEKAVPGR